MSLTVIILAAGKGKRMCSDLPKVLHLLGGTPLLTRVVKTAIQLSSYPPLVVYGTEGPDIRTCLADYSIEWVEQDQQLGTAHAVVQGLPKVPSTHRVLVLYGDVPLVPVALLRRFLEETPSDALGIITTLLSDPTGFGRIIRNAQNQVSRIVEHRDASSAERDIQEVNTGILVAPAAFLREALSKITNQNSQGEYYLTEIVGLAISQQKTVHAFQAPKSQEMLGVNDLKQLAELERYYQQQEANNLLLKGVRIMDPARFDLRGELQVGKEVTLDINVVLEGKVILGDRCSIGRHVFLKNVTVGSDVVIEDNTMIEGAVIENGCRVGPFARIRPGTVLKPRVRVGNFVEIKKSFLGEDTKANHLTYLGDAVIGQGVNVGAGTITCNYDGVNKWITTIGDQASIGANTSLIAPVEIGAKATIGAGSVINRSAPAGQLTLARARQETVIDWKRPVAEEVN